MRNLAVIVVILIFGTIAQALDKDYYFEATCYNADAEISINGCSFFTTDPNSTDGYRSLTSWLTPHLVAGDNSIEVKYISRESADISSGVEFRISSCTSGSARSTGTVLLEDKISSEIFSVDPNSDDITFLNGGVDEDNTKFLFEVIDNVNDIDQALRIHLDNDVIKWQPTQLKYYGLSHGLENGRIRFEAGQTYPLGGARADTYVEYSFSSLANGNDEYELGSPFSSSSNVADCNTITIYGEFAVDPNYPTVDPNGPITCRYLTIKQILTTDVEKTYSLTISSSDIPTWSWESGSDISDISESQEDDLWDTIVALHVIMDDATDPNELLPVFADKTSNLAAALHKTNSELESQQLSVFGPLLNDSNWGMQSISRTNFRYFSINSKLIKVEKPDGSSLFETNVLDSGVLNNASLKIPLYFALISGEWKIVR